MRCRMLRANRAGPAGPIVPAGAIVLEGDAQPLQSVDSKEEAESRASRANKTNRASPAGPLKSQRSKLRPGAPCSGPEFPAICLSSLRFGVGNHLDKTAGVEQATEKATSRFTKRTKPAGLPRRRNKRAACPVVLPSGFVSLMGRANRASPTGPVAPLINDEDNRRYRLSWPESDRP